MTSRREGVGGVTAWSLALAGTFGGGLFSVIGLVYGLAGSAAWLAFVVMALVALPCADAYARLSAAVGERGGAFVFLHGLGRTRSAIGMSWLVLAGYTAALAVYAFTSAHYLAPLVGLGEPLTRVAGVLLLALTVLGALAGLGGRARIAATAVWVKLVVLVAIALVGLVRWQPMNLSVDVPAPDAQGVLLAAGVGFMSFEGFQLLDYRYGSLARPARTVRWALPTAVVTALGLYVVMTLGAGSLDTAGAIAENSAALVGSGRRAFGTLGFVAVPLAAVLVTSVGMTTTMTVIADITARMRHENCLTWRTRPLRAQAHHVAAASMVGAAAVAGALSVVGSLDGLVRATSALFLVIFAVVAVTAARDLPERRWVSGAGALGATSLVLVLFGSPGWWTVPVVLALVAGGTAAWRGPTRG